MNTEILRKGEVNLLVDEKGIATITFSHPAHNSLPGYLLEKLAAQIQKAGSDPAVKVIVLKSGGDRTFCAGASFDELISIQDEEAGYQFFSGFARVINACRTCSKVVIGRVQGKAIGGGVGVAAAVDYCLATRYASVKLSELAIGIGPFVVGPAIERKIGLSAFSYLALNAKTFESPEWAQANGLYLQVFNDATSMDEAVEEMAASLSTYNPEALAALKAAFWTGTEHWGQLLDERARISGKLVLSDFAREAFGTFKAK